MAANTRYEPAPQRDSFEDHQYTQAPPSYQATAESAPRTEYDNLPDDFRFGGKVAEATIDIRMQFVRKVYSILLWRPGVHACDFLEAQVLPANLLFLSAFTLLEAYSISVVTSFYDSRVVVQALVLTLGIFVALTLFACQTKYDFTNWMPYLAGALWFMILFGFVAMFFPFNSGLEMVYGVVGALVFSGYILVDTQMVMRHYHVEEEIAASISLYLDVLNLFLSILRILNNQNNN
ncbi:hypothetical protein N7470_006078 [Penicillium chermesinum]|nr:hypothetical protein N7470_006078 [Penicillium chermesinum]